MPGDILCCDMDGIVVIRPEDAPYLLEKAIKHNQMEQKFFEQIPKGTFDRDWIDKALAEKGCEVINDFVE